MKHPERQKVFDALDELPLPSWIAVLSVTREVLGHIARDYAEDPGPENAALDAIGKTWVEP